MDWGLFHVEPEFYKVWRKFNSALASRNAVLKQRGGKEYLQAWDAVLVENAHLIDQVDWQWTKHHCCGHPRLQRHR